MKKILLLGGIGSAVLVCFLMGMFFLVAVMNVQKDDKLSGQSGGSVNLSSIGKNEIPAAYIPVYQKAGEKYGVPWTLLAAIHRVETVFSTISKMESPVGAIGHFQFMKKTWLGWEYKGGTRLGDASIPESVLTDPAMIKKYGGYGVDANGDGKADPFDLEDAAFSAAKYLAASGAPQSLEKAVFAYNRADWYVDDVLGYFNSYTDGYQSVQSGQVEISGDIAWVVPHTKNITSHFGPRNGKAHKGMDIAGGNDTGKSIVAFMDGTVKYSQYNSGGYGYLVIIEHGNNLSTYYAHLDEQGIPEGTNVKAGQEIGKLGNTGRSRGPHLHFEIRISGNAVNPFSYFKDFLN